MSSFDNADVRHSSMKGGGRLPRGLSVLVIAVLSVLAWAMLIGLGLLFNPML